jgi:hypothetical protein
MNLNDSCACRGSPTPTRRKALKSNNAGEPVAKNIVRLRLRGVRLYPEGPVKSEGQISDRNNLYDDGASQFKK